MGKRQKSSPARKDRGNAGGGEGAQPRAGRERKRSDADTNLASKDAVDEKGTYGLGLSVAVTFALFAVYMKTLHPSIPGGDSGELIIAAHELGVAHPPGYPVFTLAGKLAMLLIPFGNPAWRMNVLNAAFSASAGGVLSLVVYRLTQSVTSSVLTSALFALSRLAWTWSITAEVFGLNNLFVAVIMLLAVEFDRARNVDVRNVMMAKLGAFVCGLSLCNQHTIVLYVIVIAAWVLFSLYRKKALSLAVVVQIGACFGAGLMPYLYLPISSWLNKARWTWGDQTSVGGFLTHILRAEYGTFDLGKDYQGQGFFVGIISYFHHVASDLLHIGVGMAVVGIITFFLRKKKRKQEAPVVFLVMLCVYVFFFAWRANLDLSKPLFKGVVERFWMQSDLVVAVFAGLGYSATFRWLRKNVSGKGSLAPQLVAVIGSTVVVLAQVQRNMRICNQEGNVVVYDFAKTVLDNIPQNAIILTKGDLPSNSLRYLHTVENVRPDLSIFDQEIMTYEWSLRLLRKFYPGIIFPGDYWHLNNKLHSDGRRSFNFKSFLDHNYNEKRPILVCIGMQEHEHSWKEGYVLLPFGVCHQVIPKSKQIDPKVWANYSQGMANSWHFPSDRFDETSWEKVANDEMWHAKISAAFAFHKLGLTAENPAMQAEFFIESYREYDRLIRNTKDYPVYWHKNIALSLEKLYHLEHNLNKTDLCLQAIKHFQIYHAAEPSDRDSKAIQDAVELLKKRVVMLQQLEKLENIGKP